MNPITSVRLLFTCNDPTVPPYARLVLDELPPETAATHMQMRLFSVERVRAFLQQLETHDGIVLTPSAKARLDQDLDASGLPIPLLYADRAELSGHPHAKQIIGLVGGYVPPEPRSGHARFMRCVHACGHRFCHVYPIHYQLYAHGVKEPISLPIFSQAVAIHMIANLHESGYFTDPHIDWILSEVGLASDLPLELTQADQLVQQTLIPPIWALELNLGLRQPDADSYSHATFVRCPTSELMGIPHGYFFLAGIRSPLCVAIATAQAVLVVDQAIRSGLVAEGDRMRLGREITEAELPFSLNGAIGHVIDRSAPPGPPASYIRLIT